MQVYVDALTATFFAVYHKDMRDEVLSFFNAVVRTLVLQAILEQTGKIRINIESTPQE